MQVMRCLVVLLAVQVGSDTVPVLGNGVQAPKASAKTEDRGLEAAGNNLAAAPAAAPKYVGLIIGGVVEGAAIGGVIALSVLNAAPFKKQVTVVSQAVAATAVEVPVANRAGFLVGDDIVFEQGTPREEVDVVAGFGTGRRLLASPLQPVKGSLRLQTPLKFAHGAGSPLSTVPKSQGPPPTAAHKATGAGDAAATADTELSSSLSKSTVLTIVGDGAHKATGAGDAAATADTELSSGLSKSTVLTIVGVALACLIMALCATFLTKRCGGKKKKPKNQVAPVPEEVQPLNMDQDRAAEELERDGQLGQIKPQLDAIKGARDQGMKPFLRHVYAHHPPKNGGALKAVVDTVLGDVPKSEFLQMLRDYHPDRMPAGTETKERLLFEEISKYFNHFYEGTYKV